MNFFHLFGSKFLSALHGCVRRKTTQEGRQLVMAPTSSFLLPDQPINHIDRLQGDDRSSRGPPWHMQLATPARRGGGHGSHEDQFGPPLPPTASADHQEAKATARRPVCLSPSPVAVDDRSPGPAVPTYARSSSFVYLCLVLAALLKLQLHRS